MLRSVGRLTSGEDMERLRGREVLFAEVIRVEHNLVDVESGQPGIELRGEALVFEGLDSSSQGAYRRAQRSVLDGEELNAYSKRGVLSEGGWMSVVLCALVIATPPGCLMAVIFPKPAPTWVSMSLDQM